VQKTVPIRKRHTCSIGQDENIELVPVKEQAIVEKLRANSIPVCNSSIWHFWRCSSKNHNRCLGMRKLI